MFPKSKVSAALERPTFSTGFVVVVLKSSQRRQGAKLRKKEHLMSDNTLKGKRYVVFGGSSGIGLASAEALIAKGALVTLVARSSKNLVDAARALGAAATTAVMDIADEEAMKEFFAQEILYDGVVSTAGETPPGALDELDTKSAKKGFDSKFWGQYFVVKYGRKRLKEHGSIVLSSGVFSIRPRHGVGVLAAVNGAVDSFVRAMAVELAPLRINAIAPGFIDTPRLKKVSGRDPAAFEERLKTQVPLKRVGEIHEAAESVLYLLTNSYTTGIILYIDGGITLR